MAAQNGVVIAVGLKTRQVYHVSMYHSDSANAYVTFDQGAKAGSTSSDNWTPPEDVIIIDYVLAAASGQTTSQLMRAGVPTGDFLLNALHLASITTRPPIRCSVGAGVKFQIKQIA